MLILVRHGQTTANAAGLISGRHEALLTELGRRQAAAVALGVGPPQRLVSSPLRRARETAEAFGRPVEIDERWVEMDYGDLDGVPAAAVSPSTWADWQANPEFAPPGGESLVEVGARVRAACEELAADARLRDVVVVTHVSPIKAAVAWALGVDDSVIWRMYVEDAAVCRIGFGTSGPLLAAFNLRYPPDGSPPL